MTDDAIKYFLDCRDDARKIWEKSEGADKKYYWAEYLYWYQKHINAIAMEDEDNERKWKIQRRNSLSKDNLRML